MATLWRFESSLGHQDLKISRLYAGLFHFCASFSVLFRSQRGEDGKGLAKHRCFARPLFLSPHFWARIESFSLTIERGETQFLRDVKIF
ncbi:MULTISPECIES: hypothetical protein [Paraburkholderia]|uniref:hypothetical protein n=1 Tax=Paraburkholderia TaxID=1822464 RepID=UPI00161E0377|nr:MULTISPECIES: hypothetical protein [Paraburkholderia]